MVGSSNKDLRYFAEAVKEVPLSEITRRGVEYLAQNLRNKLINVDADMSLASSRCTARLLVQVKRQTYTLTKSLVVPSRMRIAPV